MSLPTDRTQLASYLHSSIPCSKVRCQYCYNSMPVHDMLCPPACLCATRQTMCLPSQQSHFVPQVQMRRNCSCHPTAPHPSMMQSPITQCHYCPTQSPNAQLSHVHLTSNNVTYPNPYYATSYAAPPNLHPSWEPTAGYHQYHHQYHNMHGVPNTFQERFLSAHAQRSYTPRNIASNGRLAHPEYTLHIDNLHPRPPPIQFTMRNTAQNVPYESRFNRRQSSRNNSNPYPQVFHYSMDYPRSSFLSIRRTIPYIISLDAEELENWQWREEKKEGLTKERIHSLPCYTVTRNSVKEFTEDERCVVCMCAFEVEDKMRILPCTHEFHADCVDQWLTTSATCPICRAVVSSS